MTNEKDAIRLPSGRVQNVLFLEPNLVYNGYWNIAFLPSFLPSFLRSFSERSHRIVGASAEIRNSPPEYKSSCTAECIMAGMTLLYV